MYVDEDERAHQEGKFIGLDGFYYNDQETITSIHFIGDSILSALVDKQIKILYTTKFKTGDYTAEDMRSKNSKSIRQ